jgi:gas vesicle protein
MKSENERMNIVIENWNEEMRRGRSRLKSEIRKSEENYRDWTVKSGNERKNIEIGNWNQEKREGI